MKLLVHEAQIAVDSAVAAAEGLASHGIIESMNFDRLVSFLLEAQEAIGKLQEALTVEVEGGRRGEPSIAANENA
jgi:hypothetical protein